MNKTLITGLFTALGAVVFAYFQQSGFPSTTVGWEVLGIILFFNAVSYLVKNAIAPSTSLFGTINVYDLLSGLALALCNWISVYAASVITQTSFNWHLFWATAGGVIISYLGTKFGFGEKKSEPFKTF